MYGFITHGCLKTIDTIIQYKLSYTHDYGIFRALRTVKSDAPSKKSYLGAFLLTLNTPMLPSGRFEVVNYGSSFLKPNTVDKTIFFRQTKSFIRKKIRAVFETFLIYGKGVSKTVHYYYFKQLSSMQKFVKLVFLANVCWRLVFTDASGLERSQMLPHIRDGSIVSFYKRETINFPGVEAKFTTYLIFLR